MPVDIIYSSGLRQREDTGNRGCAIVGQYENLKCIKFDAISCKLPSSVDEKQFKDAVYSLCPNPTDTVQLAGCNTIIASLASTGSRHNAPMSPHSLTQMVRSNLSSEGNIVIVCKRKDAFALGIALSRAYPLYNRKTTRTTFSKRSVLVEFLFVGDKTDALEQDEIDCLTSAAESVRLAAKIVDAPCNEMTTDHFLEEVRTVGTELNIDPVIIRGEELKERGFGGIYGVGKAAVAPPALAVLSHRPEGATKSIAWVGKGIVYDTGGLSIKDKVHMPGMKRDCGGAAGILGAFRAAVKAGFSENLHCVLCLAENAVGPLATRPDDIHTFYSGRTVEINNTDAEGRLVLADGVAFAARDLKATVIVDMATLTGAQGISTGRYHAAVVTNNESYETACVQAGRWSGDLAHPLPFSPELHFAEFKSVVADMKNSVKDRSNAQSSCAGLFIFAHLGFQFPGVWLHIDMASPVYQGERATGYGVGLLVTLFGTRSER